MAVQRKNPVPPGKYWVDMFDTIGPGGGILGFDAWLRRNDDKVKLLKREEHGATFAWDPFSGEPATGSRRRVWYLFQVQQPVAWTKGWGFPTIVSTGDNPSPPNKPEPQTSDDTVQKPTIPGPMEQLSEMFSDAKTVLVIIAAVWLFTQVGGNKRN